MKPSPPTTTTERVDTRYLHRSLGWDDSCGEPQTVGFFITPQGVVGVRAGGHFTIIEIVAATKRVWRRWGYELAPTVLAREIRRFAKEVAVP